MGVDFIGHRDYSRNELSPQRVVAATSCLATYCRTTSCRCSELSLQRVDPQRVVGNDLSRNELVATSCRVPDPVGKCSVNTALVMAVSVNQ